MNVIKKLIFLLILIAILLASCQAKKPVVQMAKTVNHLQWSKNLSIYDVNIRQYTKEGTFTAFEKHLPRLKEMGVGILWLMPIHPIGEKNRKGTLGSYYSVKYYLGINPEFGTFEEFKALVNTIHEMGMYVIIDWVANHCAWDNPIVKENPDWFTKDKNGNFVPPVPDWSDVIDLDYDNKELRKYMLDALKFWVSEFNIDGYRCDVAEMVPMDFWKQARRELNQIKPVFMLAEAASPVCHQNGFDMTYNWELYHLMNAIAKGKKDANDIDKLLAVEENKYDPDDYRLNFTSNHDENSWNSTVFERLQDGAAAFTVLIFTLNGMPLIYSGQESGLNKRLNFFEKDPITWKEHEFAQLYTMLVQEKRRNPALFNGSDGGDINRVNTSDNKAIFSFVREKCDNRVFTIINLSDKIQNVKLIDFRQNDTYHDIFSKKSLYISPDSEFDLGPWDYKVFTNLL